MLRAKEKRSDAVTIATTVVFNNSERNDNADVDNKLKGESGPRLKSTSRLTGALVTFAAAVPIRPRCSDNRPVARHSRHSRGESGEKWTMGIIAKKSTADMLLPLGLINSVSHAGRQAWFISTRRGRESVAVGRACSRHPPALSPDSASAERINGAAMRDIKRPVPRPFRKTDIPGAGFN